MPQRRRIVFIGCPNSKSFKLPPECVHWQFVFIQADQLGSIISEKRWRVTRAYRSPYLLIVSFVRRINLKKSHTCDRSMVYFCQVAVSRIIFLSRTCLRRFEIQSPALLFHFTYTSLSSWSPLSLSFAFFHFKHRRLTCTAVTKHFTNALHLHRGV